MSEGFSRAEVPESEKIFSRAEVPQDEDLLKLNHDNFKKLVEEIYNNKKNTPRTSEQKEKMLEDAKSLVNTFNINKDKQYLVGAKPEGFFSKLNILSDGLAYNGDMETTNNDAKEVIETDYSNALDQLIINLESNIISLKNKSKNDRIYLAAEIAPKNILAGMDIELGEKKATLTGDGKVKNNIPNNTDSLIGEHEKPIEHAQVADNQNKEIKGNSLLAAGKRNVNEANSRTQRELDKLDL